MKSYLLIGLLSLLGIVVVAKAFGDVPTAPAEETASPTPDPTARPIFKTAPIAISPTVPSFKLQKPVVVEPSPTLKKALVECPLEKDGSKTMEYSVCMELVNEYNAKVAVEYEARLKAYNETLKQYEADLEAYKQARAELYTQCVKNAPKSPDISAVAAGSSASIQTQINSSRVEYLALCEEYYGPTE